MKDCNSKIILSVLLFTFLQKSYCQLSPGVCVHANGLGFYLDAYLAALGACDCERSGVYLFAAPKCSEDPFVLEFEDEFNGDTIDLEKWQLSPSAQSNLAGGQSLELRTLNNVSVKGGTCSIIARKETVVGRAVNYKPDNEVLADGNPNLRTYNYTSSLLVSRQSFFYGKYEIRCKMPKGNGFWPAFWTFGGERYNEIDIFDSYKGTDKIVSTIYHDFDGDGKPSGCGNTYSGFDLSQWHTYGCIWEADKIIFLIDDKPLDIVYRILTASKEPVLCGDKIDNGSYFQLISFPLEPMKIIFNMAITSENGPGGSIPVDDSTPFPSSFEVDYIRFWKREPRSIVVYPNPANEKLNIHSESVIYGITLTDLAGNIVAQSTTSSLNIQLDISTLSCGIYVLTTELNGIKKRLKIIKFDNK